MKRQLSDAIKHWDYVAPIAKYPKNAKEFNELVSQLDELLAIVGNDEQHHLMGLVDVLSQFIAAYEQDHFKMTSAKGIDALKYLMQTHHLKQSDFPEIGSQGVMSEILNGKRELNLRQITLLAKRFNVNPNTFI